MQPHDLGGAHASGWLRADAQRVTRGVDATLQNPGPKTLMANMMDGEKGPYKKAKPRGSFGVSMIKVLDIDTHSVWPFPLLSLLSNILAQHFQVLPVQRQKHNSAKFFATMQQHGLSPTFQKDVPHSHLSPHENGLHSPDFS